SPKRATTIGTTRTNANVTGQPNARTEKRNLKIRNVRYIAARMLADACPPALRTTNLQPDVELTIWLVGPNTQTSPAIQIEARYDRAQPLPRKGRWGQACLSLSQLEIIESLLPLS